MKPPFPMDERNKQMIQALSAVMYVVTLLLLAAVIIHRQFILKQPIAHFEDLALVFTLNVLVFVAALLYLGGVPFKPVRLQTALLCYLAAVAVGLIFTWIKYAVFYKETVTFNFMLNKLGIIAAILAVMFFIYGIIAHIGNQRMERAISNDDLDIPHSGQ